MTSILLRSFGVILKLLIFFQIEKQLTAEVLATFGSMLALTNILSNLVRFGGDTLTFKIFSPLTEKYSIYEVAITEFILNFMTLCFLLMVYIIIGWIIEDLTFVVICALMFNPAQYLSVYLKAKGFMNISIILFEILPILIAVISVSLYSELDAISALLLYFAGFLINLPIVILFILKNKSNFTIAYFCENWISRLRIGFSNLSSSFAAWGDVLLVTTFVDPLIGASYFLLQRVFGSAERVLNIIIIAVQRESLQSSNAFWKTKGFITKILFVICSCFVISVIFYTINDSFQILKNIHIDSFFLVFLIVMNFCILLFFCYYRQFSYASWF